MNALVEKRVGERTAISSRLPYHPRIFETFGVDDRTWKVLCESIYPGAKSADSVALALSYCKSRKLDPLKKPVHIVPIWNSELRKMVDTVWPSLNLYRTDAARTGEYAGIDPASFGPDITEEFEGTTSSKGGSKEHKAVITYPEWCEITVYRMIAGQRCAFRSPRVKWKEYYSTVGRGCPVPNEQWARRPTYMLEKVAESLALRRAFPEECDQPTAEEMEGVSHQPPVHMEPTSAIDRLKEVKQQDMVQDGEITQDDMTPEPGPELGPDHDDEIEDAEILPDPPTGRDESAGGETDEPEGETAPADPILPPGIDPMHEEFTEGAKAFNTGQSLGSMPHEDVYCDDAKHWIAGFQAAKNAA